MPNMGSLGASGTLAQKEGTLMHRTEPMWDGERSRALREREITVCIVKLKKSVVVEGGVVESVGCPHSFSILKQPMNRSHQVS